MVLKLKDGQKRNLSVTEKNRTADKKKDKKMAQEQKNS